MCGIAGILSAQASPEDVQKMNSAQIHRGPDGQGVWSDNNIALGHVRLAILDLSEAGHQPFLSDDERFVLSYNGEVYNYLELRNELVELGHQFHSNTDTEVLIKSYIQWGKDCLKKFNGMWAFAIWDKEEKELFCARDHFGIKPFYYTQNDHGLLFASEIKAILTHRSVKRFPNDKVIYDYLLFSLVDHSDETFFKDIYQLPAAHALSVKDGEVECYRWWDLEEKSTPQSEKDTYQQIKADLTDSISLRLRSDVPVGSCLSGGLDSTAIVSMMADQKDKKPFKTFTAIYGDPKFDEDDYVRKTAKMHNKLRPEYIKLDSSNLWTDLCQLIHIQDEPFQSSSIFAQYSVMKAAQDANYKVLMDGQGADECLAGYDIYLSSSAISGGLMSFNSRATKIKENRGIKKSTLLTQALHTKLYKKDYMDTVYAMTNQVSSKLLSPSFKKEQSYKSYWRVYSDDFLKDHMYQMLFHSNMPALLRYEDRNSMACSIETRLPYLDPNFVQNCFSLPQEQYIRDGITKVPLREAVKGIIPKDIYARRDKIGFATPEQKWFTDLKEEIKAVFNSQEFKGRRYFNTLQVQKMFSEYCEGKTMRKFPLWRILNLELWLREFIDQKPLNQD